MAAFNKFDQFAMDQAIKVHNLNADALKVLLTSVLPVRGNSVKANLTEIAAGNGYAAGGNAAAFVSGAQTLGVYKLVLSPVQFTAAGGNIAQFQYAVLYNSTPAAGPLIGWIDYGVPIIITNGNNFLVNFDQTNGVFSEA